MKKTVSVVAAIIENNQEEILCCLRSHAMAIPNKWEFPGGKMEENEDVFQTITREIKEELNTDIEPISVFMTDTYEYETFILHMTAVKATIKSGIPTVSEHAQYVWLKRENLNSLVWAPADLSFVEELIQEIR